MPDVESELSETGPVSAELDVTASACTRALVLYLATERRDSTRDGGGVFLPEPLNETGWQILRVLYAKESSATRKTGRFEMPVKLLVAPSDNVAGVKHRWCVISHSFLRQRTTVYDRRTWQSVVVARFELGRAAFYFAAAVLKTVCLQQSQPQLQRNHISTQARHKLLFFQGANLR